MVNFAFMTQKILLIGAGLSTTHLIEYLATTSEQNDWEITITDKDESLATSKAIWPNTTSTAIDINNPDHLNQIVAKHDLVISMLPAHLHFPVAKACLKNKKHLVTASYLSNEMKALNDEVKSSNLIFLNEIGLDPGLDHLTAVKIIDELKLKGYTILEFESYTGGLVAPEYDDNPWHYKFTWNPRNVVLAGQGGSAVYLENHFKRYIPYHRLFSQTKLICIDGYGEFEGYPNRDSLKYREIYGLETVEKMIRGTLRRPGFCEAWNVFVQLGATDDGSVISDSENMTHADFMALFLPHNSINGIENRLKAYLNLENAEVWNKLNYLDLFKPIKIGLKNATPAQILQHILEPKWKIQAHEKDMIVMWHKFTYLAGNRKEEMTASLIIKGEDQQHTAMSKTVGLPLAIASKLILQNKIKSRGSVIPIDSEFYNQILAELEPLGIQMHVTS
jgi:saccharopine dehydrogenase-like NADP-dependent oxidoreductase